MTPLSTPAAQGTVTLPSDITEAQINSACLSYRHDFGILDEHDKERLRFVAKEWLHAWRKEFEPLASALKVSASPSPEALPASGVDVERLTLDRDAARAGRAEAERENKRLDRELAATMDRVADLTAALEAVASVVDPGSYLKDIVDAALTSAPTRRANGPGALAGRIRQSINDGTFSVISGLTSAPEEDRADG